MDGFSRERPKMKPFANKLRAAALAFSTFFMGSCALTAVNMPKPVASNAAPAHQDTAVVSSSWEHGSCAFTQNSLTFSDEKGNQATILLDAQVKQPEKLMCSADYSVIITPDTAVVSMGADAVLEGKQSLGPVGKRFTLANMYELGMGNLPKAKGRTESLHGSTLTIRASYGMGWSIDLADPYAGWDVY
jgi:hypothetical protein